MKDPNTALWQLVGGLFNVNEQGQLRGLVADDIPDSEAVLAYDDSLGGPSVRRLTHDHTDRYAVEDRAIFRSLQYCAMDLTRVNGADWENDAKWFARDLMEKSSKHIEALLKNIGDVSHLPLGAAIRNAVAKSKVDSTTWKQIDAFLQVCNDAKRHFSRNMDTPLFSVEDALLAYFICRKLGIKLYPLAHLATDIKILESEAP